MRQQTIMLWGGLAAAGGLYLWNQSRQTSGDSSAADLVGGAATFLDIAAGQLGALVMSRGYRNNNPGNIRFIASNPWNGQVASDLGYGIYDTPADGTRALGRQLKAYASRGLVTVRDIISTWAPPGENATDAYIADVCRQLDVAPDARLDITQCLPQLARAIAMHENGYIDQNYDWSWVYL